MDDAPTTAGPLADTARRLLSRPVDARLLVDGLGPAGRRVADGVELVDHHGTPLLLCDPYAALASAAQDGRAATLTLGRSGEESVQFRGRLQPLGRDHLEDREVEQVELRLETVHVRIGTARGVPVPLSDYHGRRDPHLTSYAEALRTHTNDGHAAELRAFASRLSGAADRVLAASPDGDSGMDPESVVASAELVRLDPSGTVLVWVDLDGAHEVRLLFPHAATCCQDLSDLLRHTLCPHG
ncbi:hypothetical protein GCM10011519_22440 [Marmoricola endophyticus]|uniref:DUF2470 domain-containing protein n=1 Tax=Marmoricola endophyticus TaxID=2040280 RepID=A0A917F4Q4_9ACTN|nr:hypothetical protein [Marmoricola endophyticus]GGF47943.1 hypothetical protein GCM10011519_22440 [Marmoricola endophyticus]